MKVTAFRWNENQRVFCPQNRGKADNFHPTVVKELMLEITAEMMRILINLSSLAIIYD